MTLWEDLILLAELLCTASVKKKGLQFIATRVTDSDELEVTEIE